MNTVDLLGYYGSDETHALSAWTSTSRELTEEKYERVSKLLHFLAQNGHHTPFEKSTLHFLVTCDTASHIHLLKHRIGVSVNGESARYKELEEDKWYTPDDWPGYLQDQFNAHMKWLYMRYHTTIKALEANGMDRKRAKESARFYLPYANQLVLDVTFNFRSFMHFQGLRNKDDAQREIQQIASKMLWAVRMTGHFNESLTAFGY